MHTIENVEICTAGMDWHASTGVHAITLENIADAVKAANEDPHIQVPRGKLGHYSDLNAGLPMWDPFAAVGDAAPAFGRFINLRTANDGAVLIGDAVDVPDWINASSYPSRSMESVPDVVTPGGKRYSMVVTAVAWLGEPLPAVQDVEDLVSLLADGPSALTHPKEEMPVPNPAAASVSTSAIRDRFNYEWAPANDHYWWWVRDLRVDPDELIVDDDEGGLWSVPYSTDGEDTVTFGEPVRVRETFTPVGTAAAAARVAAAVRTVASFGRPSKQDPPPAAASADEPTTKEDAVPEHVKQFLVAQGIDPDAATEAQITAATMFAKEPAPADTDVDTEPAAAVEEPAEPEAEAEVEIDTVAVSREVWEKTQSDIARLLKNEEDRELIAATKRRDAYADSYVQTGRITPAERALARANLDINEEKTHAAYSAMPASRVPVNVPTAATSATTDEEALLAASRARMGFTPKEA